jgi:Flp pilus assembly protein TadG
MKARRRQATHFRPIRFLKRKEGSTVVEFAIVAPVLFLLLMGTVETGLVLFANSVLEGATSFASRVGKSGFTLNGQTREQYIRSRVVALSGGLLNPAQITITTLAYSNFANVGQPEPCITASPCNGAAGVNFQDVNGNGTRDMDMGRSTAGGSGDVVLYRVTYPWPIFTPIVRRVLSGNSGTLTLTAVSTVRNEAF